MERLAGFEFLSLRRKRQDQQWQSRQRVEQELLISWRFWEEPKERAEFVTELYFRFPSYFNYLILIENCQGKLRVIF